MFEVISQVSNQASQVEFIWSSCGGFFRPFVVSGTPLAELRQAADRTRRDVEVLVGALNQAGVESTTWELSYAVAEAGFRLFNCLLPSEDETARKVRRWLEDLRKQAGLVGLEVVVEERSADPQSFLSVPWNLVYDERPTKYRVAFQSGQSAEQWRPFWSVRYNLTSGRRVEPLKRLPVWSDPRVVLVIDPTVSENLREEQKRRLDEFLAELDLTPVGSLEELEAALEAGFPRLLYWLGHATPDYLMLGDERIAPGDLRNLLRSYDDRERPEGMLAFLNACQTAEAGMAGSFLDVLHTFGFTGAIATERQTIDNFANEFGLAFLRGFLREGRPLGELLHGLRLRWMPLGLIYGAHCPPEIRVQHSDAMTATALPAIHEGGPVASVALGAAALATIPRRTLELPGLPDMPYRSLAYFDYKDRALFTGRDADIVRFAALLDRPDTRIMILHGESGIGKSSFLRAGVIPYLEGECVGYRFLRRPDGEVLFIEPAKDPVGRVAQALLDATTNSLRYETPEGESIAIDLRRVIDQVLGAPADYASLRAGLMRDVGLLAALLTQMAARLPYALVLIIDQAEEFFTLVRTPEESIERDHTLRMLQGLVDLKSDIKVIVSLRTEYHGRLLDHLRAGRRDLCEVRDDLLRDFSKSVLIEAIERPTSESPLAEGQVSPREKYGFRFGEGVAAKIADDVLSLRTEHQDSVLPLIQVICTELYERKRSQMDSDGVITREELDAIHGVEGGLKAFAEDTLERSLRLGSADRRAFKALFARLYTRQLDGTLTTWLAPRDALEEAWASPVPFAQVLESARSVGLLRVDELRIEGSEPHLYIRLGHDALAKVAASWDDELRRGTKIRRMAIATASAVALAATMAVLALIAWNQEAIARNAERHAEAQRKLAVQRRQEALANLLVAQEAADQMLTQVGAVDLAVVPQMESVRGNLLKRAAIKLDLLRERQAAGGDAPEVRLGKARASTSLADLYVLQGKFDAAEPLYDQSVKLLERLHSGDPAHDGCRRSLARACDGLGVLLKKTNRYARSEECFLKAIALRVQDSGDEEQREALARSRYNLGTLLARIPGRGKESEKAYREAIRKLNNDVGRSKQLEDPADLVRYLNNLGILLKAGMATDKARAKEATDCFEQAVEKGKSLVRKSSGLPGPSWYLARSENNLASMFWMTQGRRKEAIDLLNDAEGRLRKLAEEFPSITDYRKELADVEHNLGLIAEREGSPKEAIDHYKTALAYLEKLVKEAPENPEYQRLLGQELKKLGMSPGMDDPARAASFKKAQKIFQTLVEKYPEVSCYQGDLGDIHHELGLIRDLRGDFSPARQEYEKAIQLHRKALNADPNNPSLMMPLSHDFEDLAEVLRKSREFNEATEAALHLPGLQPNDPDAYIQAAKIIAQCPGYGGQAVLILKQAVERGLVKGVEQLNAPEFDLISERRDFLEWLKPLAPSQSNDRPASK